MSNIQPYKKQEVIWQMDSTQGLFAEASGAPDKIIQLKTTTIQNEKPKKIMTEKEKRMKQFGNKYYWELLEESWQKGIRNRDHSGNDNNYFCPILCVGELIGIFPPGGSALGHQAVTKEIIKYPRIRKSCIREISCPACDTWRDDEITLSYHIAIEHEWSNHKVAMWLKDQQKS